MSRTDLRIVHPLTPDRTVVYTYNFRLGGAPEPMFARTIEFANTVNGTGSLVLTDDLETYDRIRMGLSSGGAEWLQIGRGYASDRDDGDGDAAAVVAIPARGFPMSAANVEFLTAEGDPCSPGEKPANACATSITWSWKMIVPSVSFSTASSDGCS